MGIAMQMNDLSPTGPAAFGVIAERFRRAGQPDKALALCREGLEKFPDHLSARVTLGWSLLDMGQHEEAFDQLKVVLKRAPDNLAAIRGLAELHERGIGLVFESLSEPEPEIAPAMGDLDPILEPVQFEVEDVIAAVEPDSMFDLSSVLAVEPESAREPRPQFADLRQPISLFERAPLALRDEADAERVDELNEWLNRIREERVASVAQYMAG